MMLTNEVLQERRFHSSEVTIRCFLCKKKSKFNTTFENRGYMMYITWKHQQHRELDGLRYFNICNFCLGTLVNRQYENFMKCDATTVTD